MADVNRGDRPLSPHLSIYRPQWTSVLSIVHRITGAGMALGAVLLVWWLLAAATGPDYYAVANGVLTSWIGELVMLVSLFALSYHFCNGIRHLWWDAGQGFGLTQVEVSGKMTVAASIVLALLVWVW